VVAAKSAVKPKEISMSKPAAKRRTAALPKDKEKHKREKGPPLHQARASAQRPSHTESKQARAIAMLRAPGGATIEALMRVTGWQPHSVRGFLAGVIRKKLGLNLVSTAADGGRVYRIADRAAARTESAA
jgi:Protein of unknown function (DUF3489)